MASPKMPTEPKEIQAGSLVLDFTKSQISPVYAICLSNIIEKQKGRCFDLRTPKSRHKPLMREAKGTDSNAFSREASSAAANYSPRGFRIQGWDLHPRDPSPCEPGPREGTLNRRSVPLPEERMYFPNLIREDKEQQKWLELRCNRKTAIDVMQVAQEEHSRKERSERRRERINKIKKKQEVMRMANEARGTGGDGSSGRLP